jgi:hypothetical protein
LPSFLEPDLEPNSRFHYFANWNSSNLFLKPELEALHKSQTAQYWFWHEEQKISARNWSISLTLLLLRSLSLGDFSLAPVSFDNWPMCCRALCLQIARTLTRWTEVIAPASDIDHPKKWDMYKYFPMYQRKSSADLLLAGSISLGLKGRQCYCTLSLSRRWFFSSTSKLTDGFEWIERQNHSKRDPHSLAYDFMAWKLWYRIAISNFTA